MRTLIFITVFIAFAAVLVLKRRQAWKGSAPGAAIPDPPAPAGYGDEAVRVLVWDCCTFYDPGDFAGAVGGSIDTELSGLLSGGYSCRVEFITVGSLLLAVIRAKAGPGNKARKGGVRIWQRQ